MKNTLLFSTLVIGLALTGCNKTTRTSTSTASTDQTATPATSSSATTTPPASDTVGAKIDRASDQVATAGRETADKMREMGHDISARMTEWRLSASDIEADVTAGRPVVRTRTDGTAPTGRVDGSTIEKSIKGRLQADSQLSDLRFDVNANRKGEVELEGKARTTDEIARAMAVALDTDGVAKVTSKIKLDPKAGKNR